MEDESLEIQSEIETEGERVEYSGENIEYIVKRGMVKRTRG